MYIHNIKSIPNAELNEHPHTYVDLINQMSLKEKEEFFNELIVTEDIEKLYILIKNFKAFLGDLKIFRTIVITKLLPYQEILNHSHVVEDNFDLVMKSWLKWKYILQLLSANDLFNMDDLSPINHESIVKKIVFSKNLPKVNFALIDFLLIINPEVFFIKNASITMHKNNILYQLLLGVTSYYLNNTIEDDENKLILRIFDLTKEKASLCLRGRKRTTFYVRILFAYDVNIESLSRLYFDQQVQNKLVLGEIISKLIYALNDRRLFIKHMGIKCLEYLLDNESTYIINSQTIDYQDNILRGFLEHGIIARNNVFLQNRIFNKIIVCALQNLTTNKYLDFVKQAFLGDDKDLLSAIMIKYCENYNTAFCNHILVFLHKLNSKNNGLYKNMRRPSAIFLRSLLQHGYYEEKVYSLMSMNIMRWHVSNDTKEAKQSIKIPAIKNCINFMYILKSQQDKRLKGATYLPNELVRQAYKCLLV